MSSAPIERSRSTEALAGFLATAGMTISLIGLAYRPFRLVPFGILLALIAGAMGGRSSRLAGVAVMVSAACFALGLAFAVITSNPLW
jgi:hypothetical protein